MLQLLADPDASLQQADAHYLKQGNTCTLWSITVDGRQLVVKRYNIKSLLHRISRMLRRTRAAMSWKNAHRLAMYGILGARPVALVERRFGPLRGKAWLISWSMSAVMTFPALQEPRLQTTEQQVVALLAQLAQCRISHGDMKGTNFIQSPQGIAVIDLDAMREHLSDKGFQRLQQRDLQRFMRNWQQCPDIDALFREAMQNNHRVTET